MAAGILIFGPLSDKYGRKPVMLAGILIYSLFSFVCALSSSLWMLIFARIIQALGTGCMVAVSTAMIKDCFEVRLRNTILAVVQSMMIIAPMAAPVLGAWIITLINWRATFAALGIMGAVCFVSLLFLKESLRKEDRLNSSLLHTFGRLTVVLKNKPFATFLVSAVMFSAPYMAYIAVSSYIFMDFFSMSETTYSYFYAVNSAAAFVGPFLYIKATRVMTPKRLMNLCVIISVLCGIFMIFTGRLSPFVFLACFIPFTVVENAVRPMSTAILLDQQEGDTGSASSLINFSHTLMGSVGMLLAPAIGGNYIVSLGIILVGFILLSMIFWIWTAGQEKDGEPALKGIACQRH